MGIATSGGVESMSRRAHDLGYNLVLHRQHLKDLARLAVSTAFPNGATWEQQPHFLFRAQGNHWVHFHCASGRNDATNQSNGKEHYRDCDKCAGVIWFDPKQHLR